MPKSPAKRAKEAARLKAKLAANEARSQPETTRPKHKRRRLTDGLLGMSSAAVLTIYALGYAKTQNANGETAVASLPSEPAPTAGAGQITHPTPTPAPGSYRDGTYVAVGSSRHGDIEATVVVQNGHIASAKVTNCGTRYPCSDVDPLVDEVVTRQGEPVHYMSGATDSSRAYLGAIRQALAQAK